MERRRRQGGGALGRRAGCLSSAPPTRLPARSGEGGRRAARGREATGGPAPARPRRSPPFGPINCARRAFLFRPSHSPRRRLAPPRARGGPAVCDVAGPAPDYKYWRLRRRLPTLAGSTLGCGASVYLFLSLSPVVACSALLILLALLLCGVTRLNPLYPPHAVRAFPLFFLPPPLAPLPFLPFGCRRRCCSAGVGAARFPPRRPRSLWPRPPWVFLLKVTTSLFKNSAEKEKTLYPTLWAVISREYRTVGGREAGRVGPRRLPAVPSSSPPPPRSACPAAGGLEHGGRRRVWRRPG